MHTIAARLFSVSRQREKYEEERKANPRIQIAAIIGVLSYLYERIRTLVEFPDEQLIRRNAIERILRRRLTFNVEQGEKFALGLISELITSRYISNDWVPETEIKEAANILERYQILIRQFREIKLRPGIYSDFCLILAAREIENRLNPCFEEEALVEFAGEVLGPNVSIPNIPEEIEKLLIEIVVRRVVLKDDDQAILISLFKKTNYDVSKFIFLRRIFRHSALPFLTRKFRKIRPVFSLLRELLHADKAKLEQMLSQPELLSEGVREIIFERFRKAGIRRFWSIVRSLVYIFLSKIVILLLIELPYEKHFLGGVRELPLIFNLVVPPIFIVLLTSGVRSPKEQLIDSMVKEVDSLVFKGGFADLGKALFREQQIKRHPILRAFFWFFYSIFSLVVLGLVGYGLLQLNFFALSLAIFYIFMSLVAFFGFRIRASFWELVPLPQRENLFATFFDLLILPFVLLGRYLARTFSKLNILVLFLDFLIEVPFKSFFGLLEDWLSFVKEKKEDITRE